MEPDPRLLDIKDCLYRVAVKAFIVRDNKLLLVRDQADDDWSLPGGGIDYGEDYKQALIRELCEELTINAENVSSDYKVLAINAGHIKASIPRVNIYFKADIGAATVGEDGDIIELMWAKLEDLENISFDSSNGDLTSIKNVAQQLLS